MTFDVEGKEAGARHGLVSRSEAESTASNAKPPAAALPAPATPEPPKKPSGGGKPTLRRIK
jgi:hypothetical protein